MGDGERIVTVERWVFVGPGARRFAGGAMVLAVALSLGGCGADTVTRYGAVSTVQPEFCIARQAATGDCYRGTPAPAGVRVGDCVAVTVEQESRRVVRVRRVQPAAHRPDCP